MTILWVRGAPDDNIGEFKGIDGRGNIIWNLKGCCDVEQFVGLPPGASASIMMFGPKVDQSEVTFHRRPSLVFNQIADADSHPGSLRRCAKMCRQLRVPVINHPDKVLATTRDRVSDALQGIDGVQMPRTVRANPASPDEVFELAGSAGIETPFIVRLPGFHNGLNMVLLHGREDYASLHALPFDGRDFYLTEFVDYRDERGMYTKTRVVMIDGEPHFRHFLYGPSWVVHANAQDFMEENPDVYPQEEQDELWGGRVQVARPAFREIHRRLGLDYFGIDCHMDAEGRVLVFEANATMNVLVKASPRYFDDVDLLRRQVRAMIARRSGMALG